MSKIEYIIETDSQGQNISVMGTSKVKPHDWLVEEEMLRNGVFISGIGKYHNDKTDLWEFTGVLKKMIDATIGDFHIKQVGFHRFAMKNLASGTERNINTREFELILQTLFNF